jgi:hypothetical protein
MSKVNKEDQLMELIVSKLERIETKVDKLDERLDSAEKVAIKQEANLEMHMKRSDLLESSQDSLEKAVAPILKVYTVAWGVCKILGAISVAIGILVGIGKLLGKIS